MSNAPDPRPLSPISAFAWLALQNDTAFLASLAIIPLAIDLATRFIWRINPPHGWFLVGATLVLLSVMSVIVVGKRVPLLFGLAALYLGAMLLFESWQEVRIVSALAEFAFPSNESMNAFRILLPLTMLLSFSVAVSAVVAIVRWDTGCVLLLWTLPPLVFLRYALWFAMRDAPITVIGEYALGTSLFLSLYNTLFLADYDKNTDPAYVPGTSYMRSSRRLCRCWRGLILVLYLWFALLAVFAANTYVGDIFCQSSARRVPQFFYAVTRLLSPLLRASVNLVPIVFVLCLLVGILRMIQRGAEAARTRSSRLPRVRPRKEYQMWNIFRSKISDADRDAATRYLRALCKLVAVLDKDAEAFNDVFNRFDSSDSSNEVNGYQVKAAAEKSLQVASELSLRHTTIGNVPAVANKTFQAWTEAFEEYSMFTGHRMLNAGFLARHGRAPLDQTLHIQHYHKFGIALSKAQRQLKRLASHLGVSDQQMAEWLFGEGATETQPHNQS